MKNSKMILMVSVLTALMSLSAFATSEKKEAAAASGGTGQGSVSCPGTASNNEKAGESLVPEDSKTGVSKAGAGK